MSTAEANQPTALEAFRERWIQSETAEQYAARRKQLQSAQPHLFDSHKGQENLGVGRWITIGAEKAADGEHHGGHHVFVGEDGKMKTGAFAGQTMQEAFGSHAKTPSNDSHAANNTNQDKDRSEGVDLATLDADRKLKQQRFDAVMDELQPLNERALQLEQAILEAGDQKSKAKNDAEWNLHNRDYQKLTRMQDALNQKRRPLLDSVDRLRTEAIEAHRAHANASEGDLTPRPQAAAPTELKALHEGQGDADSIQIKNQRGGRGRFDDAKTIGDVRRRLKDGESLHFAKYGGGSQWEVRGPQPASGSWGTTRKGLIATFEQDDSQPISMPVIDSPSQAQTVFESTSKSNPSAAIGEPSPGIVEPSKTKPNEEANPGDQLGLFGEAFKKPATSKPFKPTMLDAKAKQQGLFDTHGNANQMDFFGDGVMPDDLVYKPEKQPEAKAAEVAPQAEQKEFNAEEIVKAARANGKNIWQQSKEMGFGGIADLTAEQRKAIGEAVTNIPSEETQPKPPSAARAAAMEKAKARGLFEPTVAGSEKPNPLNDVLLTKDDIDNPPKDEAFTYGDAVKTPDGKVAIMSGAGGISSDRVTLHFPDGSTQYEDRSVLTKAEESEHPDGFDKHKDQWGQHTWRPKSVSPSEWDAKDREEKKQHLRQMPKGTDVLLSADDPIEKPKAEFNLAGGAGKAHTTNDILNSPDKLNNWRVNNAFKSVDPKEHEALHAHIATVRPDLAEHSKQTLDEHARIKKAAKEEMTSTSIGAPTPSKPWDQMTRKEKEAYTNERWANYFRNTLKPGDKVALAYNGNQLNVKRVNKNGITDENGVTWKWNEIGPHGMSPKEAIEKLKEFEQSPQNWDKKLKAAQARDIAEGVTNAEGLTKFIKPEGLEAIKNASKDTLGNYVEQVAKIAPGANRSDIRKAIEDYRKSQGVDDSSKEEDSGKIKMTINSSTPHVDEIRHALEHVEQHGSRFYLRDPETGEVKTSLWHAHDNKNQAINAFINKQRAKAVGDDPNFASSKHTRVDGNYRSWLKSHGVKESDLTGVDENKARKDAEAKALATKSWGLEDYKAHMNKLDRGEVTPEEHKEAYKKFQENKEAIKAELGKLKKDDIEGWHHEDGYRRVSFNRGGTKAAAIESRLRDFDSSFDKSENANRWAYGEDLGEKTRKAVEATTADHLKAHSDEWKKGREEQEAKQKAKQSAMDNPQTAHDWQRKRQAVGGYLNLSPEEQAKHDDAYAAFRREQSPFKPPIEREIKQLSGEGAGLDFSLSKNFHSKRGHDIFTASPGARVDKDSYREMEAAAKKLGGWYYKAYGGTPGGFHFKTEEAREKFLALQKGSIDTSQESDSKQAEKQESQASRLQELAEAQRERAESKLNAPRKDNTARRARMAAGVEADARKELAQSQTLEKIASHIADGKAVHLQHVKNRAQVNELDSMLRNAKWNAIRHAEKHDANYKALPYNDREARQDAPASDDDIAHAEYPYPYIHKSEALGHAAKLANVPGLKNFAASLKKMANEIGSDGKDYGQIKGIKDLEKIREALPKMRRHPSHEVRQIASRFNEKLDAMKRLEGMDITNSHELRAALREYNTLKQQPAGADPIKEAERKLKRQKIEGFFPTPKSLIERMLDHADIEDGHEVLEPSAGIGSIMDAVKERHPGVNLHGIEQNFDIAEVLNLKGHSHDRGDFLAHTKQYDRIVMNPPFEHRQDEKHVRHAYGLLKPGGKMVAIMGAGAHSNERSAGFRDWLSEVGGRVYDTPEGAFNTDEAFRKTGVNTKMVVISKPTGESDGGEKYSRAFEPVLLGGDDESIEVDEDRDELTEQYAGKNQFTFDFADTSHEPVSGVKPGRVRKDRAVDEAAANNQLRIVGTSEDHTQCDRCGRDDLKKTIVVVVLDGDSNGSGEFYYYGSDCISKIMGQSSAALEKRALSADYAAKVKKQADDSKLKSRPSDTKGVANYNYNSSNRHSVGSYLVQKGNRFARVDGKDHDEVALFARDGWAKVSEPIKFNSSEHGGDAAMLKRNYPRWWNEHVSEEEKTKYSMNDIVLSLPVERYEWVESNHPRMPAGSPKGGEFTNRGMGGSTSVSSEVTGSGGQAAAGAIPSNQQSSDPATEGEPTAEGPPKSTQQRELVERPDTQQHHSLHYSNIKDWQWIPLNDCKRLMAGHLHEGELRARYALGNNVTAEDIWNHIDKQKLQHTLDYMNTMNHKSIAEGGKRFDDICNYNGVIPKIIAERLAGGERFFDPRALRGRWYEEAPAEPQPPQPASQTEPDQSQAMEQPESVPDAPSTESAGQPQADDSQGKETAAPKAMPRISEDQFRRAFTPKPPAGVTKAKMQKVEKAIRSMISDNDEVVAAFRPMVVEAWQQLKREAEDHNSAIREMTSATARTLSDTTNDAGHTTGAKTMQSLSAMVRKARNGDLDPSKKRGFDELVDKFERNYPHMLRGRGEDGLLDLLSQGIKPVPDILDEDVAERAITLAGPGFFESLDQGEDPSDASFETSDFENTPFSWLGVPEQIARVRYHIGQKVERYVCLSDAQREAGNYKMRHIRFKGLSISIETSKGQKRKPQWPAMPCDYGYIKGTLGRDGDHVDVFMGSSEESDLVVVVDQVRLDGSFDEHKVLLAFNSESEAIETYKKAYTKDWKVGPVTTMTIDQFKSWLRDGSTSKKISTQVSRYGAFFEPVLTN